MSWTKKGQLYGPVEWQRELRDMLEHHHGPNATPRTPAYVAGMIASSDRLVKDPGLLIPWLQTARNLLAIEMESAGVYRAARERCPMLAIRGISNIVGLKRADAWTKYACASAAAFSRAFLRTRPIELLAATCASQTSHAASHVGALQVRHRQTDSSPTQELPHEDEPIHPNHAELAETDLLGEVVRSVVVESRLALVDELSRRDDSAPRLINGLLRRNLIEFSGGAIWIGPTPKGIAVTLNDLIDSFVVRCDEVLRAVRELERQQQTSVRPVDVAAACSISQADASVALHFMKHVVRGCDVVGIDGTTGLPSSVVLSPAVQQPSTTFHALVAKLRCTRES